MIAFRLPLPATDPSAAAAAHLTLEIADGDLTTEASDAVVNAANNAFWMGGGVAGALKARGGQEIEDEAMAQGSVEPGTCVITSGGRLKAPFVIHAAVMGQDLVTSGDLIDRATRGALALAAAAHLESVSLPAFGTGVGGFPPAECAQIMLRAIVVHTASGTSLRRIRLVLFGQTMYRTFAEAAGALLGGALDGPPDCPISS